MSFFKSAFGVLALIASAALFITAAQAQSPRHDTSAEILRNFDRTCSELNHAIYGLTSPPDQTYDTGCVPTNNPALTKEFLARKQALEEQARQEQIDEKRVVARTAAAEHALSRPVLSPRGSEKPSFDCAKAKTAAARLICADAELARLDHELGVAFRKRKAQISALDQSNFVAEQLAWLRYRNRRCDLDEKNSATIEVLARSKPCMANVIQERIAFLTRTESASAPGAASPQQPMALVPPARSQSSDEIADDQTVPIAQRRAVALAEAKATAEKVSRVLINCALTQATTLMATNETAEAVAAAALELCQPGLENATRAIQYETNLELWFEGPQPRPGLSRNFEAEQSLAKALMPKLAARIMQSRAETARAPRPQASDTGKTLGTGFFVAKDGKALTNAHVVDRCHEVFVSFDGQQTTAHILARDHENDLALLATDLHPPNTANWRISMRQGEDIVVFGFPLAGVLATTGNVAAGNVTALAGLGNDSRFLQISAPVQPGNSGGPLLDRNGNVVGIVVAKLDALKIAAAIGDIPQNINFAIKASVATAFLDAQRVVHAEDAGGPPLSTPDIAERANGLAVQVTCVR